MALNAGHVDDVYRPPWHRSVRVTHAESLAEADPEQPGQQLLSHTAASPQTLMGAPLYFPRTLVIQPFTAAAKPTAETENKSDQSPAPKPVTLADFTKNVGIGGALALPPLTVIPMANATSTSTLAAQLRGCGFAPKASEQVASSALDFARSHLGQLCCVFLAGSAATIGTVEAFKPHWPWKRKLLVAAVGGLVAVALAATLIFLGIWGAPAEGSGSTSRNHVQTRFA